MRDGQYWGEERVCGGKDLGHHHMLLANALAYDWVYSELALADRHVIRDNLIRRAQESYEAAGVAPLADGSNWWRNSFIQNHHSTNNSALGVAALALEGDTPPNSDNTDSNVMDPPCADRL